MPSLSTETIAALRDKVDAACADQDKGLPGAVVVVVGRDGQEYFAHASGKRGHGSAEPMDLESVFWIASCTKMITGIACMQLVERGLLSLDDSGLVERLCPELAAVKVLQSDGTLVEKRRGITLRMLLTHTAGFGYAFFNERLRDYSRPVGFNELSGNIHDMLQPLVHHPGEGWEYGLSLDWAGVMVERVTGMSLNDYFHRNIFQPLGLSNISMFPSPSMKANLVYMNQRAPDGQFAARDHLFRPPLIAQSPEEIKSCFNSGGAGCFANPQDYCQILATLLNDGTAPSTGIRILQQATVDEMFRNQIPQFPEFAAQGFPAAKPAWTNAIPHLYPSSTAQGWGLSFMLSGGATGRSLGTAHWAGLPNLWWWCDREQGVAGIICTQITPFGDAQSLGLWGEVESIVYDGLV
ncbi:serine hydrolase domain-containing protein [Aspergillus clavatus NRRL 1]|uniref:Beta-lactamase family protein n=1 Tax=Aspergillus clavatus (strain ATCC 1007 / CBS 513.65 / DSM 816 / NCTC 3887 / NRRL 1 / QM 1276 / 107) TaxID=344612 RepID=A1CA82_ASPCL|nr:beta-lactamase family protein [Aspergillus clavatus NRRL 1]EAW12650.1 beta-lactamase family protein [Aspergillus clavatus NRRL 1]